MGTKDAERIVAERNTNGSYASMADLVRRTGVHSKQVDNLDTERFDELPLAAMAKSRDFR